MKNLAKMLAVAIFGLSFLFLFLSGADVSRTRLAVQAENEFSARATPTPPSNIAANTAKLPANASGDKSIPKNFTLGKDSMSEYGEVKFDHDSHAFKSYSPDGKSVVGCTECHHTDQPKSALKPPLLTSERSEALSMEVWQKTTQKVNDCRACHFQDGSVPEGKTMPSATYTDGGKSNTKDLTNELAYHINCNTCHDAAFKLRPELKKKPGFATTKDCTICHAKN